MYTNLNFSKYAMTDFSIDDCDFENPLIDASNIRRIGTALSGEAGRGCCDIPLITDLCDRVQ